MRSLGPNGGLSHLESWASVGASEDQWRSLSGHLGPNKSLDPVGSSNPSLPIGFYCTSEVMEGSTGNSKNVPKKSTRLGRMMGFRQYTLRLRYEPKSLQPACTKFSNFVKILDTSIVTTPTFIISDPMVNFYLYLAKVTT